MQDSARSRADGGTWTFSRLAVAPDLGSNARLMWTALAVTLVVWALLVWRDGQITATLGDTDDAMRLVLVRDLLSGRGWFDQHVGRLQPPLGVYMHWSRLLDGALAAVIWLFSLVLPAAKAELAVRFVWPLLWIYPAVAGGLAMARSLGSAAAVLICAVLLAVDTQAFTQFRPGRIDHHNVQIVMTVIAAACAMARTDRARAAVFAGVASGLGLAIGIEALAFHALIGASYALGAAFSPDDEARPARNYAIALVLASAAFYAIQTPPWRWSLPFCDALAVNLVIAIAVAGMGLAAVATWAAKASLTMRIALIAVVGAAAAGAYLAFDPACLRGPFAAVDPRMHAFWFDRVQELQSWPKFLKLDRDWALQSITITLMAVTAAVFLLASCGRRPRAEVLLAAACVVLAAVAASQAIRMHDYVYWFGVPALGAAYALLAPALRGLWPPIVAASLALSPTAVGQAISGLARLGDRPVVAAAHRPAVNGERCYDSDVYGPLAALPPGVVLAEIDLGPFILAQTRDSVLAAPYHRMSWGILAAHDALAAPPAAAEAKVRALNAAYVIQCTGAPVRSGAGGLERELLAGRTPGWLQLVSAPGQALRIYRMRPQAYRVRPQAAAEPGR